MIKKISVFGTSLKQCKSNLYQKSPACLHVISIFVKILQLLKVNLKGGHLYKEYWRKENEKKQKNPQKTSNKSKQTFLKLNIQHIPLQRVQNVLMVGFVGILGVSTFSLTGTLTSSSWKKGSNFKWVQYNDRAMVKIKRKGFEK